MAVNHKVTQKAPQVLLVTDVLIERKKKEIFSETRNEMSVRQRFSDSLRRKMMAGLYQDGYRRFPPLSFIRIVLHRLFSKTLIISRFFSPATTTSPMSSTPEGSRSQRSDFFFPFYRKLLHAMNRRGSRSDHRMRNGPEDKKI